MTTFSIAVLLAAGTFLGIVAVAVIGLEAAKLRRKRA